MSRIVYSYSIIRYEHDSVKGEFINVGIFCISNKGELFTEIIDCDKVEKKAFGLWGEESFKVIHATLDGTISDINYWIKELEGSSVDEKRNWFKMYTSPRESLIQFSSVRTGFLKPNLKSI